MSNPTLAARCRFLILAMLAALGLAGRSAEAAQLPDGFVDASDVVQDLRVDLRYFGSHNFVGVPIHGYRANRAIMTWQTAQALSRVQDDLRPMNLGLLVFDAYRPTRAVDHFVEWALDPSDEKTKVEFYPRIPKRELFAQGYISLKSGHSRGSTVDVTIVPLDCGAGAEQTSCRALDMGTEFDFFGPESNPLNPHMPGHVQENRMLLRKLMIKHGFRPYQYEWWHFTLVQEPFPKSYFNFEIL